MPPGAVRSNEQRAAEFKPESIEAALTEIIDSYPGEKLEAVARALIGIREFTDSFGINLSISKKPADSCRDPYDINGSDITHHPVSHLNRIVSGT